MIYLLRADGIFASRVSKYVNYYKKVCLPYKIIGWDRVGGQEAFDHYDFFHYKTKYVQGGIKAIIAKIKWMKFVYRYIKKHRDEITTIHACDLDVALPAALYKKYHKKNLNIIFDVCDWYSASMSSGIVWRLLRWGERVAVKYSDYMIICEPERINQIQYKVPIPVYTMRNIPDFDDVDFLKENNVKGFDNEKITVAYVGWFGNGRFIEELLDYVEKGKVNLLIAGYGKAAIEEKCKELDEKYDFVKYFGKVDYKYGLQILNASDIIYAMYCKHIPNHIYAAPNKFYESMFLGKPILSTKGIGLEGKIKKYGTGYTINESMDELAAFFENTTKEELINKGKQAHDQWPYFCNLTEQFMNETYSKIIK